MNMPVFLNLFCKKLTLLQAQSMSLHDGVGRSVSNAFHLLHPPTYRTITKHGRLPMN